MQSGNYTVALASCLARRAFLRLAAFLCITPFDAALSIAEVVTTSCAFAVWGSAAIAASSFLTEVRTALLIIRLRRFFFSLTLTRFLADLIFGNFVHLPVHTVNRRFTPLNLRVRVRQKTVRKPALFIVAWFPEKIKAFQKKISVSRTFPAERRRIPHFVCCADAVSSIIVSFSSRAWH